MDEFITGFIKLSNEFSRKYLWKWCNVNIKFCIFINMRCSLHGETFYIIKLKNNNQLLNFFHIKVPLTNN